MLPEPPQEHDPAGFQLGYRPELDGLRGLAILAVMVYHSGQRFLLPGGFLGVDVFFVLSGFLITILLLQDQQRRGSIRLLHFYLRRVRRLLPALLVMLTACCLFAWFRTKPDRAREIYRAVLLTLGYGANWAWCWSLRLDLLSHAWSLSLEEQFYLLWPALLWFLLHFKVRLRSVAVLMILGILGTALLRGVVWLHAGPRAASLLATRADALLAGCLVGWLTFSQCLPRAPAPRRVVHVLGGVSALVLVYLGMRGQEGAGFFYLGGFTLVAGTAALGIAALMSEPPRLITRLLSTPVLVGTGRISYGLYLWHFPLLSFVPKVMHSLIPLTRQVPSLDWVVAFLLAFGAATLSYYFVELPIHPKQAFGIGHSALVGRCSVPSAVACELMPNA
ncbi:MAG: acyltransferase [Planctomycetes bacterium]|nr:acyltransferase [Planctomycetota bacterium]